MVQFSDRIRKCRGFFRPNRTPSVKEYLTYTHFRIRCKTIFIFQVETAINVSKSCAHITDNDRCMSIIGVSDESAIEAHLTECKRITEQPTYRDLTLIVDGSSMSFILNTHYATMFSDIALNCNAVLCCRLSPLQKANVS